jgi:two-component system, OmpR family, sensor histidine kinase KdpD
LEIPHLDPAEKELASLIESETVRLENLTNKVLETAELDEADFRLDHEKIALDEFLEECQAVFAPVVNRERLGIAQKSALSYVWSDRRLLQLALLQIMDNAARYAKPGSPITLSVHSTESEIVFSVQNEGPYVAPQERLRIFDRFYRSAAARYKAPGSGICLTATKKIVEAHGRRAWVDSAPEEKTTFFIALPQIQKESSHGPARPATGYGADCRG